MRIEIQHAHNNEILNAVHPGDEVTIRAFVEEVSVEALDVTAMGKPPKIIHGDKTVRLIIEEITR